MSARRKKTTTVEDFKASLRLGCPSASSLAEEPIVKEQIDGAVRLIGDSMTHSRPILRKRRIGETNRSLTAAVYGADLTKWPTCTSISLEDGERSR